MAFLENLKKAASDSIISSKLELIFSQFFNAYNQALSETDFKDNSEIFFDLYLKKVIECIQKPFKFESIHKAVLEPFNYYHFGIDFVRPLVVLKDSTVLRSENLDKIEKILEKGENAVLFANHQTETDPQLLSLMVEKSHPRIAKEIFFVAGDRVLTDPLAVPFSMGRNLICIYSKRHIDNPPEKKEEKLLHNRRTMKLMKDLLSEGGKCIYVAPSGGRDRPDEKGVLDVAEFDPSSIELFRLITDEAKRPTHFFTLALATYNILPPPSSVETELGEVRRTTRAPIHFAFGDEISLHDFPGSELKERQVRRQALANHLCDIVKKDYQHITKKV